MICLNSGRFYENARQLALAIGVISQRVTAVLLGKCQFAKGHSMRLATADEIKLYDAGQWTFNEPLLPVYENKARNRKTA